MAEVRRLIGPVAWCVLEVLVAAADPASPDGCAVGASVRSSAAELGVSKNTAARAVVVLRRAGLLRTQRQPRANGRFGPGQYVLITPNVDPATSSSTTTAEGDPMHSSVSTTAPRQLSLLPNH